MAASQAVLPPPTGWGFEPKSNNQVSKDRSNGVIQGSFGPGSCVASYSDSNPKRSAKRRNSDDSDMSTDRHSPYALSPSPVSSLSNDHVYRRRRDSRLSPSCKRARVHKGLVSSEASSPTGKFSRQPLPMNRMLESLDRKELEDLIVKLCESHGQAMVNEIGSLMPRMTTTVALANLKKHHDAVFNALPYRVDEQSDYAYYRVKPYLDEFMSALVDYGLYFLPPNESQPSTSLTFLETATELLCNLPNWDNPMHNHAKFSLLDELSSAWITCFKEASKSSNAVGLMLYNGWERKLENLNELAKNHLLGAVNYLRQELAWVNDISDTVTVSAGTTSPVRFSGFGISNV